MKQYLAILSIMGLIISGCSFGEYADSDSSDSTLDTSVVDGKTVYEFTTELINDSTYYLVRPIDGNWSTTEYDFNSTGRYVANQLDTDYGTQDGNWSITEKDSSISASTSDDPEGYLKLTNLNTVIYVQAVDEDEDKIKVEWTTELDESNVSTLTDDIYLFKKKTEADKFTGEEYDSSVDYDNYKY